MTAPGWVGVDPGGRYAGVVGILGRVPVTWAVIDRDAEGQRPETYRTRIETAVSLASGRLGVGARVAIEGVVAPNAYHQGKLKLTDPADQIELARVLGWLEHAFPGAVIVRPGKHGHQPWGTYPEELMTPGEARNARLYPLKEAGQSTLLRHARSAYDVARNAPTTAQRAARSRLETLGTRLR